ncbi:vam6/Vps39-like protein [Magallana gigas]|uniref:Vam6/Vps39-like protein n=1 Tax=Magallana gigas TaxID=29159 RepID=K1Q8L2_MAGGI|eukprot:XP_011445059.1 PREDICTED: vam6/Vps39-like protein [Crassostrea gigas]
MHDAYESTTLLEKLPLKIEAIACYDDILLVGTKEGHLLQYKIKRGTGDNKYDVVLERSNKNFGKKPITQLYAVPELFLLISLTENVLSVHDLKTFQLIVCLSRTKGATLFAVDVKNAKTLSGGDQCMLRVCVAVRKKLQIMFWKNKTFHDLEDFTLYEVPKAMCWCKDSICVGFYKREYFLVKVNSGDTKELFPLGSKQQDPIIARLDDDRLMLGRDESSILIDSDGNPTQRYPISWSDLPIQIENNPPYVIAVLPKYVEVRTVEPRLMIQNIPLSKAHTICQGSGHIYISSQTSVWKLTPRSLNFQIKQLLESKEFELALKLADMTEDRPEEKDRLIHRIRTLYAFHQFCQHKFEESMAIFVKLGTDPSHVIGLYPNLLPQEFRNQLTYPERPPDLEGGELEKALLALQDYLTQKRKEVSKDINKEIETTAIKEGDVTIKSKKQLSQIIDTTLLKCYLQTNDALVAPLLRLKDNNCHVEESEKVLKKKEKFSELIILYEKKGLHEKALQLLVKQAARPNSPLKGHDRTVQYLQHLGKEHLKLIFEYAEWVLKEHQEDGLKIFTEDLPEVENLPREEVLNYLENINSELAIPYLEHIIWKCDDKSPEFHNRLAQLLQEKVQKLMKEYLQGLPEGHIPKRAGQEPGELGQVRSTLLKFLNMSEFYIPERLLTRFPLGFYEERAILLGRLGRHEQALGIYVHVLHDDRLAEEYCKKYYRKDKDSLKDVYFFLLKMYLDPPSPSTLGVSASQGIVPKPNMNAALRLMKEHAPKIDTSKSLELLPSTTKMSEILAYLENVMEHQAMIRRKNQVLKSMLYAENLQVHEQRMFYEKCKVTITDEKMCRVCRKKIGNSAFVRYPNGVIVHYYCCKDPKECPVEV